MSCMFCESNFHRSEFCEIYASDKSRKEILWNKKICEFCILSLGETKHEEKICSKTEACYICFSRMHHTVFCPDRETVPKLFIPKIDEDLVPRFAQTFDTFEKYSMAFSAPEKAINLIRIKPLQIIFQMYELENPALVNGNSNVILDGQMQLHTDNISNINLFLEAIASKIITLKAPFVFIYFFGPISPQNCLLLLTPFIKALFLRGNSVVPKVEFGEILQGAPNVTSLYLDASNSWPEEMMKYINGNDFEIIDIQIPNFDIDFECLAKFLRMKCSRFPRRKSTFRLECKRPYSEFLEIENELLAFFIEEKESQYKVPSLNFTFLSPFEYPPLPKSRTFSLKEI